MADTSIVSRDDVVPYLAGEPLSPAGKRVHAVYKAGRWEDRQWRRHVETFIDDGMTAIGEIKRSGKDNLPMKSEFFREVFARANCIYEPEKKPEEKIEENAQWQKIAHEELDNTRQWRDAVEMVKGDTHLAGALATGMCVEFIKKSEKKDKKETPGEYAERINENRSAIRQKLRASIDAGMQKASDLKDAMSLAGTGSANGGKMNPDDIKMMAEKMKTNPAVLEVSRLAGKMKIISDGIISGKSRHGRSSVKGVTIGSNISMLLPQEVVKLKMGGGMALDVLTRLADGRALQYSTEGTAKLGKGPRIVLVDRSSSMTYKGQGHERFIWAYAFTMALLHQSIKEKVPFIACGFSNGVHDYDVISYDGNGGKPSPGRIIEFCSNHPAGGTDITSAFSFAQNASKKFKGDKAPDVVLISDGEDERVSGKSLASLKASGARLMSVFVGGRPSAQIRKASDYICEISTDKDTDANEVFARLGGQS